MTEYRLDELEVLAAELGLSVDRVAQSELNVLLGPDITLGFRNLTDSDDTLVGFVGTPWHAHGAIDFVTDDGYFVSCDELEMLIGIDSGELVVRSHYQDERLLDRWLGHKLEPIDTHDLRPGEEVRILRVSAHNAQPDESGEQTEGRP